MSLDPASNDSRQHAALREFGRTCTWVKSIVHLLFGFSGVCLAIAAYVVSMRFYPDVNPYNWKSPPDYLGLAALLLPVFGMSALGALVANKIIVWRSDRWLDAVCSRHGVNVQALREIVAVSRTM